MIYVGLDDTDMPDAPGTNKLARALATHLSDQYACTLIVRHQLLQDPRVPCTSKNSAASMLLRARADLEIERLVDRMRAFLRERFVPGSDPGLCVTQHVPQEVTAYARRCQRELVTQEVARRLGAQCGIHLEGLGGTEDGVIGALAAVGLIADGNDGRVVQIGSWPDDLAGWQDVEALRERGVEVRCIETESVIASGHVDVGKHLRPNYRGRRIVLFVRPVSGEGWEAKCWQAVRLL